MCGRPKSRQFAHISIHGERRKKPTTTITGLAIISFPSSTHQCLQDISPPSVDAPDVDRAAHLDNLHYVTLAAAKATRRAVSPAVFDTCFGPDNPFDLRWISFFEVIATRPGAKTHTIVTRRIAWRQGHLSLCSCSNAIVSLMIRGIQRRRKHYLRECPSAHVLTRDQFDSLRFAITCLA